MESVGRGSVILNWTLGFLQSVALTVYFYRNLSFYSSLKMCFIYTWEHAIYFLIVIISLHVSDIFSSFLFLILYVDR